MDTFNVPAGWQLRSSQKDAIGKVLSAFKSGKRIVVLQAPTGSGKSLIGRVVANHHDSSYLLTPLLSLQDQYFDDFSKTLVMLKGKSNYECQLDGNEGYNVEESWCQNGSKSGKAQIKKCREANVCDYYRTREEASLADCTLLNFMGFVVWMDLRAQQLEPIFDTRSLHVIDEAHKIEDVCRSYLEFKIKTDYINIFAKPMMHKFPDNRATEPQIRIFINELHSYVFNTIVDKYQDHGGHLSPVSNEPEDKVDFVNAVLVEMEENLEMKKDLRQHVSYFRKIEKYMGRDDYAAGVSGGEIVIQPTNVLWFIREHVLGDFTLMMSATIPKDMILAMGFTQQEIEYIEMDSTFPKENRPIFLTPAGNMNGWGKKLESEREQIEERAASFIDTILGKFPDGKGIIHVNSFDTSIKLEARMKRTFPDNWRRMIFHGRGEMGAALEKHINSPEPTIIVSPSMKEGVDLKEDLSRVQIIYKCPYPSLSDPATKSLSNSNPAWYKAQTLANFMQMYGRSIRSETDTAKTYILDEALIQFLRQNYNRMPRYLIEAIHWR